MWRSVLLGAVLAGVLAGCSLGGGSGAVSANGSTLSVPLGGSPTVVTGQSPTSDQVTLLVKPMLSKVRAGTVSGTECALEGHRTAKCDFVYVQGVGGAVLVGAWFRLRPGSGGWSVVPICRGAASRVNPLCRQ
jgi:hypothetical protein